VKKRKTDGTVTKTAKKIKKEKEEQKDEEVYKWWLEHDFDSTIKWNTLQHNGPMFPPPYKPHNVKMKYDGIIEVYFYINSLILVFCVLLPFYTRNASFIMSGLS